MHGRAVALSSGNEPKLKFLNCQHNDASVVNLVPDALDNFGCTIVTKSRRNAIVEAPATQIEDNNLTVRAMNCR